MHPPLTSPASHFLCPKFQLHPEVTHNHIKVHFGDVHLKPDHSQFNLGFSKPLSPYSFPLLTKWVYDMYKMCVFLMNYLPSFIELGKRDLVEWLEELLRHLLTGHHSHPQFNPWTL